MNDKKIFSTPQGFKDVLNGIYITASGEKLYANNLLFGFTDVLAQYYAIPDETHEFAQLAKYRVSHRDNHGGKRMCKCLTT